MERGRYVRQRHRQNRAAKEQNKNKNKTELKKTKTKTKNKTELQVSKLICSKRHWTCSYWHFAVFTEQPGKQANCTKELQSPYCLDLEEDVIFSGCPRCCHVWAALLEQRDGSHRGVHSQFPPSEPTGVHTTMRRPKQPPLGEHTAVRHLGGQSHRMWKTRERHCSRNSKGSVKAPVCP